MKNLFFCIIFSLFISLGNSCQKAPLDAVQQIDKSSSRIGTADPKTFTASKDLDDLSVKGDFEARDGILHFKNLDSFIATEEKLKRNSNTKENFSITEPQFQSLNQIIAKVLDQVADTTNKLSDEQVLLANEDILELVNNRIETKSSVIHDNVVNREGMVYIGKTLYRFTRDQEIIVLDGDIKKARQAGKSLKNEEGVRVFPVRSIINKPGGRSPATCPEMIVNKYSPDQKRLISFYGYQHMDYYLATGCYGCGSGGNETYNISHNIVSRGKPYIVRNNGTLSSYITDNHMYVFYQVQYSSIMTNYQPIAVNIDSGPVELFSTTDYLVYHSQMLASAANVPSAILYQYYTNATFAFGYEQYFAGYYYSSGVPDRLYQFCQ